MDISTINYLAVIVAALATFVIGGLWYSPVLFGTAWMKENGFTEDQLKQTNMVKLFGFSFLFSLVMAFNLAMFLNDTNTTAGWGAAAGFLAGFGWVSMAIAITALFERRSGRYILIHAGYMTVSFVVMGFIIGIWR